MRAQSRQHEARSRVVKIAFGVMALVCLLTGLVIFLFADRFGLSADTANIVAIAFLAAGAGDYFVLKFWDRLFVRR